MTWEASDSIRCLYMVTPGRGLATQFCQKKLMPHWYCILPVSQASAHFFVVDVPVVWCKESTTLFREGALTPDARHCA